jgi:hypothetical protein
MPNRDKTGPEGKGTMTGRGFGNCVSDSEKDINVQRGNRIGRFFRRCGMGCRMGQQRSRRFRNQNF